MDVDLMERAESSGHQLSLGLVGNFSFLYFLFLSFKLKYLT